MSNLKYYSLFSPNCRHLIVDERGHRYCAIKNSYPDNYDDTYCYNYPLNDDDDICEFCKVCTEYNRLNDCRFKSSDFINKIKEVFK